MAAKAGKRVRYTFEVHFNSAEEKQAFTVRLADILSVSLLSPAVLQWITNLALLEAMFAKVDGMVSSVGSFPRSERGSSQSFLRSSGTRHLTFAYSNNYCSNNCMQVCIVEIPPQLIKTAF